MNQTTERTMAILQLIAEYDNGITLQEIANHFHMAKSSASVIVHTLLELHYIKTMENNEKKYCLSVETFMLGMKYVNRLNYVRECSLYLPSLAEKYNRTAFAAVLNNTDVVYMYKYAAQNARLATCAIGSTRPAYATALGKAIVAFLSPEEQKEVVSHTEFRAVTPNTITSRERFMDEMRITKNRGYSREQGELADITICYGAPIFDYTGKVIASISLSDIYDGKELNDNAMIHDLCETAMTISRNMGYQPSAH